MDYCVWIGLKNTFTVGVLYGLAFSVDEHEMSALFWMMFGANVCSVSRRAKRGTSCIQVGAESIDTFHKTPMDEIRGRSRTLDNGFTANR
jgi:hypothetical protein